MIRLFQPNRPPSIIHLFSYLIYNVTAHLNSRFLLTFLTFRLFLAIFSRQFFKFCWTRMRWDKGIYRTSSRFVVLSFTVYLRLSILWEWTSTVVRTSKKTEILPIFCTGEFFYCFDDGDVETSSQFIVTFSKLILVSLCGLVDLGHFQFSLWYLRPVLTDCQSFPLGTYHLSRCPQLVNRSLLYTDHKGGNNASRHKKLYSGSLFRRKTIFGRRWTLF